jgi:predicted N-acyltransferase
VQALFTDQAATNAARQFNASSQNQVDQFFANLANNVSQFNATQANAQNQFNAGQANTIARFNEELGNQRDQFNAQNQTVIAQANAQWRRQIATADTAAINRANEINATNVLDISKTAYDNLWQYYSDAMEFAWESADNELERQTSIATARIAADATISSAELQKDYNNSKSIGAFAYRILTNFLD